MTGLTESMLLPDYSGACVTNIVPTVVAGAPTPQWFPVEVADAEQVVLLVIDGLGWNQLQERLELVPTLRSLASAPITTVAPTTTSTALTSITTGAAPGEHGIVGYRIAYPEGMLNVLRWTTKAGDARQHILPADAQQVDPFCGTTPRTITQQVFADSGFTLAHLGGEQFRGYWATSALAVEVGEALEAGDRFVYAYYDGLDKIGHVHGIGAHYDAELRFVDQLVDQVLAALTPGAVLLVTADHGQVDCGKHALDLDTSVASLLRQQSGEPRFRWLHAASGRADALLDATRDAHAHHGWVASLEQVLDEQWFGPVVTPQHRALLGDVALLARDPISFHDDQDPSSRHLIARHGSLTADEVMVPLLAGSASTP